MMEKAMIRNIAIWLQEKWDAINLRGMTALQPSDPYTKALKKYLRDDPGRTPWLMIGSYASLSDHI